MQDPVTASAAEPGLYFWKKAQDVADDLKGPRRYARLPSYGQAYMDELIGEFNSLQEICANDKAKTVAQEVIARAEAGETLTWGDAYMLDTAIAQMLPQQYLHQRAWCLEVKYRDAAGNTAPYDAFMKAEAPHLINEAEDHLRARIHNMIRELYRLYTVISCRADMREKLSRTARNTLLAVLALEGILLVVGYLLNLRWHFDALYHFEVLGLVFAAGATGGLLSLQRKLQSLPSHGESLSDLVELSGRMTVPLTPILGGIFAVVLLLIFASGLVYGSLFPTLTTQTDVSDFGSFFTSLHPKDGIDWGKLLVWSFLAGFAERLVPDTLDRLIAQSERSKKAE